MTRTSNWALAELARTRDDVHPVAIAVPNLDAWIDHIVGRVHKESWFSDRDAYTLATLRVVLTEELAIKKEG